MIRLLSIVDGQVRFQTFANDHELPDFSILSHTWAAAEDEVVYQDIEQGRGQNKAGYAKILHCGYQAQKDNHRYFWVDTCCIDKTNSSELGEAINCMYRWYASAKLCYAYLPDVKGQDIKAFENSRWFTRGWTLQELLAPKVVRFYDVDWTFLGNKQTLSSRISQITGISPEVLCDSRTISECSISERMSWAAHRRTTRVEDRAYSLLGIFGIDDMPMMYGQGETVFRRLQEKIIDVSNDHTVFAWQGLHQFGPGVLARSPDAFVSSGKLLPLPDDLETRVEKQMVEISIRLRPCDIYTYIGILNCASYGDSRIFAIYLRQLPGSKRYARVQYKEEDCAWISESEAGTFQPTDRITVYQDVSDLRTRLRGVNYNQVPSIEIRLPETLLSVRYTAKAEGTTARWNPNERTFVWSADAERSSRVLGSLRLEKNDFDIEVVRLGFDESSHPVCMVARSYALEPASGGKKAKNVLGKAMFAIPVVNFVAAGMLASGSTVGPTLHKGKGIWGYSPSDELESSDFWDHDGTALRGPAVNVVFDRNERLGLWLLRGNRSNASALDVRLLANKFQFQRATTAKGGMELGIRVAITKNVLSGPYIWDLTMDTTTCPVTTYPNYYKQWMGARDPNTT